MPIEEYQVVILDERIPVYNFHVEDYECYYVSEQNVLVHNNNPCGQTLSIKGSLKQVNLPTKGKIRYIPPKGAKGPVRKGEGYIDKFGNVWVKGRSRTKGEDFEWDVQLSRRGKSMLGQFSRDGKHLNVSLKG